MQRAFWYGVGCYLILASLVGLGKILGATANINDLWSDAIFGFFLLIVCVPFSIGTIRTAQLAPPNTSSGRAIAGWLIGFFFVTILFVVLAALGPLLQRWY
jgi:hypothetical protein